METLQQQQPSSMRGYTISELIETEERYIEDLGYAIVHYLSPTRKEALLSDKEFAELFGDLLDIFNLAEYFYRCVDIEKFLQCVFGLRYHRILPSNDHLNFFEGVYPPLYLISAL